MSKVGLLVNGKEYTNWISVTVTRSIRNLAGSFSLSIVDQDGLMNSIKKEDECEVQIDGKTVIKGFVERRSVSFNAAGRTVTFTGYDAAQALYANSVDLGKWTFKNMGLLKFAQTLAEPHGVKVALAKGLVLPDPSPKVTIAPGESALDALLKETAKGGVLLVSDGAGGILITQGGRARAESLVEGRGGNIFEGSSEYDGGDVYRTYVVLASKPGSKNSSGDANKTRATATDLDVQRADRVQVIRPNTPMDNAAAKRHADWIARTRAASAETVTIKVDGWKQTTGDLWPPNALAHVTSPSLEIDGDMLIASATASLSESEGTLLQLVRPDAYTPDPSATVRGAAKWKTE